VLTDLSGFTRLTEALDGTGAEGSEVLHRVVTTCFHAVLGRSIDLGGDILAFAGDAALVWFDAADFVDHLDRAVDAASTMARDLASLPAATTGGRRLKVSVGVHTGGFDAVLAGSAQRAVFLHGPEISLLAALQSAAPPGTVRVSEAVADAVPAGWRGAAIAPGIELRRHGRAARIAAHAPAPVFGDPAVAAAARSLVSPDVVDLLHSGVPHGDHRTATVGFVYFGGLDSLRAAHGDEGIQAALEHVVDVVTSVAADESVDWLDVDVGVDSVKLLLTAGAPRAVDDDEGRMLVALRRMIDECRYPLRAGAQRGRLFASTLGVRNRRGYTVLGDAANVAARALGMANDRELLVADGIRVADRVGVECVSLGAQLMKNRDEPMELWRVDTVGPRTQMRLGTHTSDLERSGVGARPDELRHLLDQWKQVVDSRVGQVVVIEGEPGFGASELISAVVDHAGSAAVSVVVDPFRQRSPFSGVRSLVQSLRTAGGSLVATLEPFGAATSQDTDWAWLASQVTALPSSLRDWAPQALAHAAQAATDVVDPLSAASRTHATLAGLLAAALPSPCLLAIDDIDRMDDASRGIITRLCDTMTQRAVMLLVSVSPPSVAFATSVDRIETIHLEPLDRDDARLLVQELAPTIRHDVVERIIDAGAGNPFVLTELALQPGTTDPPDSLQRLAAWLIDALPMQTRQLVREAAVAGTIASPAMLASLLDRPDLTDPAQWEAAASVLRLTADGSLTFRHDIYRRVAYDSLSFERRRHLHGALADLLATDSSLSDATRAQHLQIAGRIAEAYPLAVSAARAAQSSGALVEAIDLFERAVEMARTLDRPAVGELLIDQAATRTWLGDIDGAEVCLRSAVRYVSHPAVSARLCHQRADIALRRLDRRGAKRWIDRGLALLSGWEGEVATRCHLVLDESARLDLAGRYAESVALAERALEIAHAADNDLYVGLAHLHIQFTLVSLMDEAAIEHGDAARQIFTDIGHDRFLEATLNNSGLIAMYLGRWDQALDHYESSLACARRSGNALSVATAEMNIGFLSYRMGNLDDAAERARRAMRTFDAAGVPTDAGCVRLLRAYVATALHDTVEARLRIAEARAVLEPAGEEQLLIDCDVTMLDVLLLDDHVIEALALATEIESRIGTAEPETQVVHARLRGMVEVRAGAGDGRARIERALRTARERGFLYEVYRCLDALIGLATSDGDALDRRALVDERDELRQRLGIIDPHGTAR
jgi:class 3 adenylate cyclase/tetratricopeptide (TPR) repeat protein